MSDTLLKKYLGKKKKDLLDYAKLLESLLKLEKNTLWNNKTEFSQYAKEVINIYVDEFYFDNNIHRDNPVEYCNDNINTVLKCLIKYCKENNQLDLLQNNKNETFLLSVLITTSAYLDIATNVVDGNYNDTKTKFRFLLEYFQKTNILKVYRRNNKLISNIFEEIRKRRIKEEKFFASFTSPLVYNEYLKKENYYFVKFHYNIAGLNSLNKNLKIELVDEYMDKLLKISLELLEVKLIQELLTNKEVNKYLVRVSNKVNENIFSNIKESILENYVKIEYGE